MNIQLWYPQQFRKKWMEKWRWWTDSRGCVIIDPDEETLREYEKKQQDEKNRQELLQQLKGKPTVTKEGKENKIVCQYRRSERFRRCFTEWCSRYRTFQKWVLYLQSDHFPTEDEQFQSYKTVAEVMAGKSHYPYSGYWSRQADRLLWTRTRGQSGAWLPCREDLSGSTSRIFQDTVESNAPRQHVRQYFHYDPMIASVWEVKGKVKEIMEEVKAELTSEGIPFKMWIWHYDRDTGSGDDRRWTGKKRLTFSVLEPTTWHSIRSRSTGRMQSLTSFMTPIIQQCSRWSRWSLTAHTKRESGQVSVGNSGRLNAYGDICKNGIDELSVSPAMVLPVRDKILNA